MQKPSPPVIFGAVFLTAAGLFGLHSLSRSEKKDLPSVSGDATSGSGTTSTKPTRRERPIGSANGSSPENGTLQPENAAANAPTKAREEILEEINDAAVTYDPADLPRIEPYLSHPDEEIRQAAMNGMVTLGDASAGVLLRKAASLAPTPQEAVRLLEAADYVELPSATLRRREK